MALPSSPPWPGCPSHLCNGPPSHFVIALSSSHNGNLAATTLQPSRQPRRLRVVLASKMGLMEDKEEDDTPGSGIGSHQRNFRGVVSSSASSWACMFLATQQSLARATGHYRTRGEQEVFWKNGRLNGGLLCVVHGRGVGPCVVFVFSSSPAMERDGKAFQGLCFLFRKNNGGGDLVGA